MPVNTRHNAYSNRLETWEKVRDAINGQEAIKAKREKYLPKLGGQTPDNYDAYLSRAQFYDISERTLNLALGQVFRKTPHIPEFQEILQPLLDDIDLTGQNFIYFSKTTLSEIMQVNRAGILVDYNDADKRPFMTLYKAESIINWQEIDNTLSRVVLEGEILELDPADQYKTVSVKVWKELYLENGVYKVRDWRKTESAEGDGFVQTNEYIPIMGGKFLDFIPFFMFTTHGIRTDLLKPPLLGFVNLNLGHYKNSADYENLLHWTGAKTIITRGFGADKSFPVGGCADFPTDGGAEFLEASSDSGLKEEMRHKEEQMAVMGSALLAGKGRYVASAETATKTAEGEYATLADISNSLSVCMSIALSFLLEWAGHTEGVKVEYNTDFEMSAIDSQTLTALMGAYQSGAISFETFFYNLKNREMYPEGWTIEEERAELDKVKAEKKAEMDKSLELMYAKQEQTQEEKPVN